MNSIFSKYEFQTWTEFMDFVNANKEQIIGKCIDEYHCYCGRLDMMSDEPVVIVIGNLCVSLYYLFLSSITIHIFSKEAFENDRTLNFLYRDKWESRNVSFCIDQVKDIPISNQKIQDVIIDRFSEEFEINPSTGETRPEGGDYFSTIRICFENGKQLCICAEDAIFDGYVDNWIE